MPTECSKEWKIESVKKDDECDLRCVLALMREEDFLLSLVIVANSLCTTVPLIDLCVSFWIGTARSGNEVRQLGHKNYVKCEMPSISFDIILFCFDIYSWNTQCFVANTILFQFFLSFSYLFSLGIHNFFLGERFNCTLFLKFVDSHWKGVKEKINTQKYTTNENYMKRYTECPRSSRSMLLPKIRMFSATRFERLN